jgi:hypothetical protein
VSRSDAREGLVPASEERDSFSRASPPLRTAARIALVVAAVGSLALMFRSIHRNPSRLLIGFFVCWVLGPFVALAAADAWSRRWSTRAQATVHALMLTVALAAVGIYGADAIWPRKAQAAFVYIAAPPALVLFSALVVSSAGLISRRQE